MNGIAGVMVNSQTIGSSSIAERNDLGATDAVGARNAHNVLWGGLFLRR